MVTRIYTAADVSGGTIVVPSDYDAASASWHAIGGSPAATDPGAVGGGGVGGGAWARTDGLTLTPGGTVAAQIGTGDVWISTSGSAPTSTSEGVLAKGGATNSGATGGAGGASGSCIGTATNSGGAGGSGDIVTNRPGGGGGGAGGPNGNGAIGGNGGVTSSRGGGGGGGANGGSAGGVSVTTSSGGSGGNNRLGAGGGSGASPGGGDGASGGGGAGKVISTSGTALGSTDGIWTDDSGGPNHGVTVGPGSGGGGGRGNTVTDASATGGQGGLYGGGAGGSGEDATSHAAGRDGVIVLVYTPSSGDTVSLAGATYALTGGALDLRRALRVDLAGADYALTGGALDLRRALRVDLAGADYALTGGALDLTVQGPIAHIVSLAGATYALTGGALVLTHVFPVTLTLEGAFIDRMVQDVTLRSLVGNHFRIHPVRRAQGDLLPAIVVQRFGGGPLYVDEGHAGLLSADIQVDCWGTTYTQAKSLSKVVRDLWSAYRGTYKGITFSYVMLDDERDFSETGSNAAEYLFRTTLKFTVWQRGGS